MLKRETLREKLSKLNISREAIKCLLSLERNSSTGEHHSSLIENLESLPPSTYSNRIKFGIVNNAKSNTLLQEVLCYFSRVKIKIRRRITSTPESRAKRKHEQDIRREAIKLNQQPYWLVEMKAAYAEGRQLRDEHGRKVSDSDVWSKWSRVEWEAQLQRVAQRLEWRYGAVPFYAKRAAKGSDYWRNLASSSVFA
ncbi:MAG TPA: hypothetical protein PK002_10465 [Cellvibrio sp.]|nr:hypothetical protein [Cellvibrio sp.]